jgi:hypothetical protein
MEESVIRAEKQFSYRLLILYSVFCIFFTTQVYAEKLSSPEIGRLRIIPLAAVGFTGQNCGFRLTVPGVSPKDVRTTLPPLPEAVFFESSKRFDYVDAEGDHGTQIEYWFSFAEPGSVILPPLEAVIAGHHYTLPFDPVRITENPSTVDPVVILRFLSGIYGPKGDRIQQDIVAGQKHPVLQSKLGEPVVFTVCIRYAVRVLNVDWELQKDSLFTELKQYEITEKQPGGTVFSSQEMPVADFQWEPLITGTWHLPVIKISASAFNGMKTELPLPECDVSVQPSAMRAEKTTAEEDSSLFAYAFLEPPDEIPSVKQNHSIDYKEIAELRSAERHSFPFSRAGKIRHQMELRAGIVSAEKEASIPLYYCCLFLAVTIGICIIVFFMKHRYASTVLFAIILFCFLVVMAVMHRRLKTDSGIFAGGMVTAIPEKSAAASVEIPEGSRVLILEKAGNWIYIEYNDAGGWITKDCIYTIQ